MRRFGEKLRTLRTQRGMTVRELAVALGYAASSNSYISETETGKRTPKIEFVLKVAQFFGVSTDQLVRDDIELDADIGSASAANDQS
jgi:transcriptional regulator with XRE-family HTH domain